MHKLIKIGLSATVLCAPLMQALAAECDTPLPVNFTPPTKSVEGGANEFIGVWGGGKWDKKLCHTLVVESVDADGKAQVIYSYGVYDKWNIKKPGFNRDTGVIVDSVLTLDWSKNGIKVEYRLDNGKLKGKYILLDGFVTAELTRK